MKKTITASLLLLSSLGLHAQSGTNSPYSQYGLGELSEQSGSFSRGMNGLAYGLRLNNQVNALNPASYSALDSLSFIFDAGVSLQMTQFKEGGRSISARNADLEYVVAGLRLFRHVGVSFGLLPYTNVGYDYSNSAHINGSLSPESPTATYNNKYSGSQGLHQVYLGVGAEPLRNLSVGVNASYLWGGYTKYVTNTYSDAYVNTLQRTYTAEVRSYKLDFGLQYTQPLSAKDQVTLGLTYSLGHSLNADPELSVIKNNSQLAVADTTHFRISNALDLPHTFGVGAVYSHNGQLMVGARSIPTRAATGSRADCSRPATRSSSAPTTAVASATVVSSAASTTVRVSATPRPTSPSTARTAPRRSASVLVSAFPSSTPTTTVLT